MTEETCTGLTARWCPRCGDCTCPLESLGDLRCPLHSFLSPHAEEEVDDGMAQTLATITLATIHPKAHAHNDVEELQVRREGGRITVWQKARGTARPILLRDDHAIRQLVRALARAGYRAEAETVEVEEAPRPATGREILDLIASDPDLREVDWAEKARQIQAERDEVRAEEESV